MKTDQPNPIIVRRSDERWVYLLFFLLSLFCTVVFALYVGKKLFVLHTFNNENQSDLLLLFFLSLIILFTIFQGRMLFCKRFLFEISDTGIKDKNGMIHAWPDIYALEIDRFPTQGLRTIYYLIGPRGVFFYRTTIYHDFLMKKKTRISFSSDINLSIDEIEDALINYALEKNINVI